jgi:methyl-accepting chemotaxis protein
MDRAGQEPLQNGDHYWVLANATPIFQNGVVTGYMSVRTAPSRNRSRRRKVPTAFSARDGAAGLAIREGQVVKAGFSLAAWLNNRSIAQRIFAIGGLLTAGMVIVGGLG